MQDSPDGVCPGQAGFEYPATSAPFSSAKRPGSSSSDLTQICAWVTSGCAALM
jgi:hypothetical protein